ncbi:MAG: TolC family protein [Gammaproteobacteria bacterium]|nr:TolC family protein [Gammaproteobacteria bacterium]
MSKRIPTAVAALLLSALTTTGAGADEGAYANLKDWLATHNPELAAMREEGQAARARVDSAGKLPDPMLRLELMDIDRSSPRLLPGQVGQTRYTLSQAFPLGGKLTLREQEARAEAEAAGQRIEQTRYALNAMLRMALAEHHQAEAAAAINREVLALLERLEAVAQVRYANGSAPQQDVLKAQTERSMVAGELMGLAAEAERARARLNALLGRGEAAPLHIPGEPPPLPGGELAAETLHSQLAERNPELAAGEADIAAADFRSRLADKEWLPDVNVGVGPVQVDDRVESWQIMLEVNLPLQFDRRRAMQREARAMRRRAEERRRAAQWQLASELDAALAGYARARERESLYGATLLPQAQLTLRSALAGYETGKVDFGTLIEAERAIRAARLERVRAQFEQQSAYAAIERITGDVR